MKEYAEIEQRLVKLAEEGRDVKAEFRATYDDSSVRPTRFEIKFTVDGGDTEFYEFFNRAGG